MLGNWFGHKKVATEEENRRTETSEHDGRVDAELVEDELEELIEDEEDPEDTLDAIEERVYAWGEEWSQTPAFEALSQQQKDESVAVITHFADYMYTYHDVAPEEWNG